MECAECRSSYFVETRDGDQVCESCGNVAGRSDEGFNTCIDSIDFNRCGDVNFSKIKLIQVWGPKKYRKQENPKGWTYKALFHGAERIAQLDCSDPEIPATVMASIRAVYRQNYKPGQYIGRKEVGDILEHVSWPEDQLKNKKGKERTKSVRKVYLERWIRIRYELTGLRPEPVPEEFKEAFKQLFCAVVRGWCIVRHGLNCPARRSSMCYAPRQNGCRHNLPNYNFIFQQLISHLIDQDPIKNGFADMYLDYFPTLTTPKRRSALERYWKELFQYTKIPLYKVRDLTVI